jgi:hypothetical protein
MTDHDPPLLTIPAVAARLGVRASGLRYLVHRGVISPPSRIVPATRGYAPDEVLAVERAYHAHVAAGSRGPHAQQRRERSRAWLARHAHIPAEAPRDKRLFGVVAPTNKECRR